MINYPTNKTGYGDTSKISSDKFSVRANKGILNNYDKSSYEISKASVVKGISSK
jgi:hypothetical protein|tara:strand:+ start:705 stop:866 length:162 start_codon:yes stop_codon:yes gene_type:complete